MGAGAKTKYFDFYLFNIYGEYVGTFNRLDLLAKLKIADCSLRCAIRRKSCIGGLYYVSLDKNFVIPTKTTYSHNPLLSKMKVNDMFLPKGNLDFLNEYETYFD